MSNIEELPPNQIIQYLLDGFDCGLNSIYLGLTKILENLNLPIHKSDEILANLKYKIETSMESSSRVFTQLLMQEVFAEYSTDAENLENVSVLDKNLVDEARMLHMQLYNEKFKNLKFKQDLENAEAHVEELRVVNQEWPNEEELNQLEDEFLMVLNN